MCFGYSHGPRHAKINDKTIKFPRFFFSAKPNITTRPPKSYTATKGDSILLQCSAQGTPKPEIIWAKKNSGRAIIGSHFILENALPEDTGNWTCRASNFMGTDTADVEIVVASKCLWAKVSDVQSQKKLTEYFD